MANLPNLGGLSLTPQRGVATGIKDGGIFYGDPGGTVMIICNCDQPFNAMMLVVEENICKTGAEWRYNNDWENMVKEYAKKPGNEAGGPTKAGKDGAMWGPPGGFADARRDGSRWRQKDHGSDKYKTFDPVPGHRWRAGQRELVEELGVTDREMNLEYICELCRRLNAQRDAMKAVKETLKAKIQDLEIKVGKEKRRALSAMLETFEKEKKTIDETLKGIDDTWTKEICKICGEGGIVAAPDQFEKIEEMRKNNSKGRGYDWRRLLDDKRTLTQTWINLMLDTDDEKSKDKNDGDDKQLPPAIYALLLPYSARTVEMVMLGIDNTDEYPECDDAEKERRADAAYNDNEEKLLDARNQKPLSNETLSMDWTNLYDLCNKDILCPDAPSGMHFEIKLFHRSNRTAEAPVYVLRHKYAVDTIQRVQKLWNMPRMQPYVKAYMRDMQAMLDKQAKLDVLVPYEVMTEEEQERTKELLTYQRMNNRKQYKARLEWLQSRRDIQDQFAKDVRMHFKHPKQVVDLDFNKMLEDYKKKGYYADPDDQLINPDLPLNELSAEPWNGIFPKDEIDIVTTLGGSRKASCTVDWSKQFAIPPRPYPVTQNSGGTANKTGKQICS